MMDTVIVKWQSGNMDTCYQVNSNQIYSAVEGQCLLPTALNEDENSKKLFFASVYPNPVSDNLCFIYTLPNPEKVVATIVDATGKSVLTKILSGGMKGMNQSSVDIKKLNKGFYVLILTSGNLTHEERFVKN